MLGLGLGVAPAARRRGLIASSSLPAWVPANSLAFYDFQNDRAYSNGIVLPNSMSGVSTSRSTVGYDLAATTLFAANAARRTSAGLLVEATATNLYPNSQSYGNGWSNGVNSDNATFTQPSGVAPDGSSNSVLIAYSATNPNQARPLISNAAGAVHTYSIFQKGAVGGEQNDLSPQDGSAPYTNRGSTTATLTTAWQRNSVTFTPGLNSSYLTLGNNGKAYPARSIYAAFIQLEVGANPTSYIPTTGSSATRAADNITLTLPAGTVKVELAYDNGTTNTVAASAGSFMIPANPANANLKSLRAA